MNPVLTETRSGELKVWDWPIEGKGYVVGADVAEGRRRDVTMNRKGRVNLYDKDRPDYSAACVLEIETGLHVATWHGYLSPDEYAVVVAALGQLYNMALVVVELNGPGLAVVTHMLERLFYENLYRTRYFARFDAELLSHQFGWQTTKHTRKILIKRVSEALNGGGLFTRDRELAHELRTMEFDDQGTERARGKHKDDRVFALALALEGRYTYIADVDTVKPHENRDAYQRQVWRHVKHRQEESLERKHQHLGRYLLRPGLAGPSRLDRR